MSTYYQQPHECRKFGQALGAKRPLYLPSELVDRASDTDKIQVHSALIFEDELILDET